MAPPAVQSNTKEINNEEAMSRKFDIIGHLPGEIVQMILLQLSYEDLHSALSCCSSWKATLKDNEYFWKSVCEREGYSDVEEWDRSEFCTNFLKKHNNHWEGLYWYHYNLQRNWETNNYKEVVYELAEEGKYVHWYLFEGLFGIQSMTDHKFFIFQPNKELKAIVVQLKKHDICSGSRALLCKRGKFAFLCKRATAQVVDLDNETTFCKQAGHYIRFLHMERNLIVLAHPGFHSSFSVLNCETGETVYEYKGRKYWNDLVLMSGKVAFVKNKREFLVINLKDKSAVKFKCCHDASGGEHALLIRDDLLLSFCIEKISPPGSSTLYLKEALTVCVWHITFRTKLKSTYLGFNYDYFKPAFMNKYLCLQKRCYNEIMIELWDYMKGIHLYSIPSKFPLRRLKNNQFIIAAGSSNVALWCLRTGNLVWELDLPLERKNLTYEIQLTDTKLMYYHYEKLANNEYTISKLHIRNFEF